MVRISSTSYQVEEGLCWLGGFATDAHHGDVIFTTQRDLNSDTWMRFECMTQHPYDKGNVYNRPLQPRACLPTPSCIGSQQLWDCSIRKPCIASPTRATNKYSIMTLLRRRRALIPSPVLWSGYPISRPKDRQSSSPLAAIVRCLPWGTRSSCS